MSIIPKLGGKGGGLIRGAASTLVGNVGQQIRGVVSREAIGVKPSNILGTIQSTIDNKTGGLLSQAKSLIGITKGSVGAVDQLSSVLGGVSGKSVNTTGMSQWGGLSEHLFAVIFPCDATGVEAVDTQGISQAIAAPATDVQMESTLNWQSPFEQAGPESKAPTIMAALQTGQVSTVANALQSQLPAGPAGDFARDLATKTEDFAKSLEGRTGITKLNSRQVFSGMPPVRITLVLHLRAVTDPETEVVAPYQKLLQWAWPQKLAPNGVVSEIITNGGNFIHAMFPSEAPQMIGFRYGNNRYAPMVIESVSNPLDGPMDSSGRPIYRSVQLTLATLTALDKNDVAPIFSRS